MKRNVATLLCLLVILAFLPGGYLQAADPGTEKWSFETEGPVRSSPAIAGDGTIYVGSDDNRLYALNPDGTEKWMFSTGGKITSSPTIGPAGTIYFGSHDNKLYSLSPDGTKNWTYTTGGSIRTSPAIGPDGTIYVGSDKFYAFNPDGTKKWDFDPDDWSPISPAVGKDGTVYIVYAEMGHLYALTPEGTLKWEFSPPETGLYSPPVIAADGTIYVASDSHLYALNPDGTRKWTFDGGVASFNLSPIVGPDEIIYLADFYTGYAVYPDGTKKWSKSTSGVLSSTPAVGADGTGYVAINYGESESYSLFAINPDGSVKWSFSVGNYIQSSSPVIDDSGTLYIGSNDNKLYAIHGESGGLANAPWPMFQRDLKHTGRVPAVVGGATTFSAGTWWADSNGNFNWDGEPTDEKITDYGNDSNKVAIGDLDNDYTDELVTFNNGTWWADTNNNYEWDGEPDDTKYTGYGNANNQVAIGDLDGDEKDEQITFSAGTWWVDANNNHEWDDEPTDEKITGYGNATNKVAVADFDGDGTDELATYNAGTWWIDADNDHTWDGEGGGDLKETGYGNSTNRVAAGKLSDTSDTTTARLTKPTRTLSINESLAYPNPVTGESKVTFEARGENIRATRLQVFTASGRKLYSTGYREGTTITWDMATKEDEPVPNGVYLYQLKARGKDGRNTGSSFEKLLVLN